MTVPPEWASLFGEGGPFARFLEHQYQQFDELPAWLQIPEAVKSELAVFAAADNNEIQFNEQRMTPEARVIKEQWEALKAQAPERIEQLLGYPTYAYWREYHDTQPARQLLTTVNSRLGESALNEDTVRILAAAMTRAARQAEQEHWTRYGALPKTSTLEGIEAHKRLSRRTNELVREAVLPYLAGEQLQVFEEVQKRQQLRREEIWAVSRVHIESREGGN